MAAGEQAGSLAAFIPLKSPKLLASQRGQRQSGNARVRAPKLLEDGGTPGLAPPALLSCRTRCELESWDKAPPKNGHKFFLQPGGAGRRRLLPGWAVVGKCRIPPRRGAALVLQGPTGRRDRVVFNPLPGMLPAALGRAAWQGRALGSGGWILSD